MRLMVCFKMENIFAMLFENTAYNSGHVAQDSLEEKLYLFGWMFGYKAPEKMHRPEMYDYQQPGHKSFICIINMQHTNTAML